MKVLFLLPISMFFSAVFSQEELGIVHSNYATTNVIGINPANGVLSKQYLDINIIGVHGFANNNMVYIEGGDFSFKALLSQSQDQVVPRYDLDVNKGFAALFASGSAPGFVVSAADHSFGLQLGVKAFGDGGNMPSTFANYLINQSVPVAGNYQHTKLEFSALSYAEIEAHYSRNVIKQGNHLVSAGVNLGYLIGIGGGGFKMNEIDYTVIGNEEITLNQLSGEYMYVNPAWNSGKGFSLGLGAVYSRMEENVDNYYHNSPKGDCNCEDYKWKVGASIVDFGWVNFKNNANYRNYNGSNDIIGDPAFADASVEELNAELALRTSDDNQEVNNTDKIFLPGAVSLQGDYKILDHIYLGGTYTHGFAKGKNRFGVQRSKLLSFNPRIEFKRFEFAIPVSLYEWSKPQLGAMLRLNNNIIVGTDKLGTFLGKKNIYGADIYISLKLGLNRNPACGSHEQSIGKDTPYRAVKYKSNGKRKGNKKAGKREQRNGGKSNNYSCPSFN